MNIQLTLAARYLAGRRLRAFLTTLAVVFGVIVIFAMNIILPSMLTAFQSTMLAASDKVDLTASLKSGDVFPAAALEKVRAVKGIRVAQGLLAKPIAIPADFFDSDSKIPDRVGMINLIGLDPESAREIRAYTVGDGRFLETGDTAAVVVSKGLAEILDLRVGEFLPLPTAKGAEKLTVVGIASQRNLPGNEEAYVPIGEAQAILGAQGKISSIEADLESADTSRRTEIEAQVLADLGSAYTLESLSGSAEMISTLSAANLGFSIFGALALFMGAFIIFNTFRTIVAERRRDIGMLRAIGANRRTIIGVILAEGLLQGVIGTAVGMILGYALAAVGIAAVQPLMQQFIRLEIGLPEVTPGIVGITAFLGIGVTLAAGFFPALAAGRTTPMEALRPAADDASYRRKLGASGILGIACIAAAIAALVSGSTGLLTLGAVLFMVGLILIAPVLVQPISAAFGALLSALFAKDGTGLLAKSSLARQPSRAAVTASTTMIALALVVGLGSMTLSITSTFMNLIRNSLGSDYLFIPPSIAVWKNNIGSDTSMIDRLRGISGVETVSSLRYAAAVADVKPVVVKGKPAEGSGVALSLMGIDPASFPKVSALAFKSVKPSDAYAALAGGRAIIATPIFAMSAGIKEGDVIPMLTAEGPRDYRIAAIASDFMNAKMSAAYISQANMAGDFGKSDDMFVQLNLAPKADAVSAEAAIKAVARDYPQYTVIEGRSYVQEMESLLNTAFSALYLLFVFMALPSLITTINTLAISVIERTREIGMLRAVGMSGRQLRRMILAEAILLAAFGTAFGLVAGLYLGYLIVNAMAGMGFDLTFTFPWIAILTATIIGLGIGALAAVIPAKKAASLQIVEALRYE